MRLIKPLFFVVCFLLVCANAHAQKPETFEGITYTMPKGWQKNTAPAAMQFIVDSAKGTCLVTLFKPLPGSDDSKKNFASSWETVVKGVVNVAGKPEMQPVTKENGWTAESGFAAYEADGKKGVALLITMTGGSRMVNILVLTNTDAFQSETAAFLDSIKLPKLAVTAAPTEKPVTEKAATPSTPRKSNYKFNTTNFDDGWTAVEQDDWARVTKDNIAVLVHYPNRKADAYNSVLRDGLMNAWNILVAPRYVNVRNFALKPIQSFESISFAEADAEDKATGKTVYIVLFKKHVANGKYLEFISGSKREFEQEFGAYRKNEFGWEKLTNMQGRNKFDVSPGDLTGTWSTSDYASLSYYYVNGGGYAGATATSSANSFTFAPSGTYQSDYTGASGVVGNQKFSRQVYKGNFTVSKWTLTLTNRFKGESETYNCHFEAIKGGRILMLVDKRNSVYSLVKQ